MEKKTDPNNTESEGVSPIPLVRHVRIAHLTPRRL